MTTEHHRLARCLAGIVFGLLPLQVHAAPLFSLDAASPTVDGIVTPGDVLGPGAMLHTPAAALGLQDDFGSGSFDDLADFSFGDDPIRAPLYFSVDRVAIGLPGSQVHEQARPGVESAAADVHAALPPQGSNRLNVGETGLGLRPGFFGDDIDGLDLDGAGPAIYFTLQRTSASNGRGARDLANDILASIGDGRFGVHRPESAIGPSAGDAIDGLVLDVATNTALFSLDPFSPSMFTVSGLDHRPCVPGHVSPADVCITRFDGSYFRWASAADIGLAAHENFDALDTVAEPATPWLVAAALAALRASDTAQVGCGATRSRAARLPRHGGASTGCCSSTARRANRCAAKGCWPTASARWSTWCAARRASATC